jgi:hypothetical protein
LINKSPEINTSNDLTFDERPVDISTPRICSVSIKCGRSIMQWKKRKKNKWKKQNLRDYLRSDSEKFNFLLSLRYGRRNKLLDSTDVCFINLEEI